MGSWLAKSAEVSQAGVAHPEEPVVPPFLNTTPVPTSEPLTTKSSEVSQAGVAHPEETISFPAPTPAPIKTKEELLAKFGPPTTTTGPSDGFFATCYQEDCFLMGGLRNKFTERMVWTTEGKQKVAYLNGDRVLKIFG